MVKPHECKIYSLFFNLTSDTSDDITYGEYNSTPPPHDWFSPLDDESMDSDDEISFAEPGCSLEETLIGG